MKIDDVLSALDKLVNQGAYNAKITGSVNGEFAIEANFRFGNDGLLDAIADPPLPEDPEERAREMKRRSDEIDFHSA